MCNTVMGYSSPSCEPERVDIECDLWKCFGNVSFPKIRGCSGAEVCVWAAAGAAWCRLFHRNIFSVKLSAVWCDRVCFYTPGKVSVRVCVCVCVCVCACFNFPLKKTRPCYLGGSAPPWRPRTHRRTHSPVCRPDWGHRWTWATAGPTASSLPRVTGDRSRLHAGEARSCPDQGRQGGRWELCTWQGWQVYDERLMLHSCHVGIIVTARVLLGSAGSRVTESPQCNPGNKNKVCKTFVVIQKIISQHESFLFPLKWSN